VVEVKQTVDGDYVHAASHVDDILVSDELAAKVDGRLTALFHTFFRAIVRVVAIKVAILRNLLNDLLMPLDFYFIIAVLSW
jgi:hypothetical protein